MTLENGKLNVRIIYSGSERKPRVSGEKSRKKTRGTIGFDFQSSQQQRYREELKKYFIIVAENLTACDNLYIIGPAEAKTQLEKTIKSLNLQNLNILAVENSNDLTDNQLIAKVHKFFSDRLKLKRTPRKLPRR